MQSALARKCSQGLLNLEMKLRREINEVLMYEEMLWKQKSLVEWLRLGDRNTRFFQSSTIT